MADRPRCLDLFCGAGGAGYGYHLAGYEVVGVDHVLQKRYPFRFIKADALELLAGVQTGQYDLIHASPPCQQYSPLRAVHGRQYPDLVAAVREALIEIGTPYVIENVVGAPLTHGVTLCGTMFNLRVYRHRTFETSTLIMSPPHPKHTVKAGGRKSQRQRKAHYEAGGFVTVTGNVGSYCGPAMGIDWMTGKELSQAIPPAYTRWIGEHTLGGVSGG